MQSVFGFLFTQTTDHIESEYGTGRVVQENANPLIFIKKENGFRDIELTVHFQETS